MMNKPLFLVLSLFFLFSCAENDNQPQELKRKTDSLVVALEKEKEISDSIKTMWEERQMYNKSSTVYFGKEFDSIKKPEEYIISELKNNPEVIPLNPVLGGKMHFRRIEILNEKWIYAMYDDGHIEGTTIYEYLLLPDGNIEFLPVLTDSPE